MAAISYFIAGPSLILSLIGLIRGQGKSTPTKTQNWKNTAVDVIIPAFNEQATIDLCLASLARQTFRPRKIFVYDDGSTDNTTNFAFEFSKSIGLDVTIIRRERSVGKTTSVREGAFKEDAEIEFILDSDTILESDNYIARIVEELYNDTNIASACGTVLPLTEASRSQLLNDSTMSKPLLAHYYKHPEIAYKKRNSRWQRILRGITNTYREVLYKYLEKVVYPGQQALCKTMINPIGCAVGYRKRHLRALFEHADATIGRNLTTSEDIYFGFAFNDKGLRNIQVRDVQARTLEPLATRLPNQIFLWSSAFFQSIYFTQIIFKRPFKRIGWFILFALIEKIFFPIACILLIIFRAWEALVLTLVFETLILSMFLLLMCANERLKMFAKSIAVTPIRYFVLWYDLYVFIWFMVEIAFKRDKEWKK